MLGAGVNFWEFCRSPKERNKNFKLLGVYIENWTI